MSKITHSARTGEKKKSQQLSLSPVVHLILNHPGQPTQLYNAIKMSDKQQSDKEVSSEFTSFYLQLATNEFAEDLDAVRGADDFKHNALPMLIRSLEQGTAMFSPEEKRRIVEAGKAEKKKKKE